MHHVFRLHGLPSDIVSDRGPQFTSQVWKAFCSAVGATAGLSSGYHPQNGQTEQVNQELEAALCCVTSANPSSRSSQLPWVEYTHNMLPNASARRDSSPPVPGPGGGNVIFHVTPVVCGGVPALLCNVLCYVPHPGPRSRPTVAMLQRPTMPLNKRYGCLSRISL